jgi:hypothetical protein
VPLKLNVNNQPGMMSQFGFVCYQLIVVSLEYESPSVEMIKLPHLPLKVL